MMDTPLRIAVPAMPEHTKNYFAALTELGAEPVTVERDCDAAEFDGLLLPGGGDVAPERFGEEMNGSNSPDPDLDDWQFTVMEKFVALKKPIFGICRGEQVINIYFGGTLIQHLPQSERHAYNEGDRRHPVVTKRGSFLAALYGEEFRANSAHHQGAGKPGRRIDYVGFSDDGVVEALQHRDLPIWGVQFHPERMCFAHAAPDVDDGSSLLRFFLEECRAAR